MKTRIKKSGTNCSAPLKKFSLICIIMLFTTSLSVFSAITVKSLAELLPHLDDDGIEVIMKPGTYTITAADIKKGLYGSSLFEDKTKVLLLFKGSNSTYDFTGVTLNIETAVFKALGKNRVNEITITGNNNVLKNLTMVDVGSVHDGPTVGALGVCMDGKDNRVEGFHMTVKGSFPYGYGDAFGKGGKNTIRHQKHSAFLIRGLRNHAKNCTIIHRSYGHAMFMQAASYPIIEGCHIEGEVRKTDDMLAETSGPAFDIDFKTIWGYRLPAGYMLSLGEGGIRAYNGGQTIIDGKVIKRGTDNPTILNCTIKHMRTGVTIAHATGKRYVEGCVVIGCENGFSLGKGEVVNCSADCTYGPVYSTTYERDANYNAEITIIPSKEPYYNGSKCVAYIAGSEHNITLKGIVDTAAKDFRIMVGGDKENIRLLNGNFPHQNNFTAKNIRLNNMTEFPVELSEKSSAITLTSKGKVTDHGAGNKISKTVSSKK